MMALAFWAASVAVLRVSWEPWSPPSVSRTRILRPASWRSFSLAASEDGVEQQGAARGAVAGDGAGAGAGVDLGLVEGAGDVAGAVGIVGEQVDIDVEGDEEGFVLGGEHVAQEGCAGLLFEGKDVHLAAGGVEQDANGEGKVLLLGKVLDGLRGLVFGEGAVVLDQVGDEAFAVAGGEVEVDQVDLDVDGGGVGVILGDGGRGAVGRWAAGRGRFLGAHRRRVQRKRQQSEREQGRSEGAGAHGVEDTRAHSVLDDE